MTGSACETRELGLRNDSTPPTRNVAPATGVPHGAGWAWRSFVGRSGQFSVYPIRGKEVPRHDLRGLAVQRDHRDVVELIGCADMTAHGLLDQVEQLVRAHRLR